MKRAEPPLPDDLAVKDDLGVERSHLSVSIVLPPESRMLDLRRSSPLGMTLPSRRDQRIPRAPVEDSTVAVAKINRRGKRKEKVI